MTLRRGRGGGAPACAAQQFFKQHPLAAADIDDDARDTGEFPCRRLADPRGVVAAGIFARLAAGHGVPAHEMKEAVQRADDRVHGGNYT